ncbi:gp16 family phage-associated protein [Acinetobacter calcoaceticus]|uniref:Gp16 family phage-associated protein n=1 Tax=Acinetobacter calcoaceticus TaxID=471 RepID=A0A4R1XFN8_ACICA|nr:gp16 family phage-associated protein [Acinetobacter calcoaceticus]
MPIKTPEEVKKTFEERGQTVANWASQNDYRPQDVYKVLNGQAKCKYGIGHEIAVKLGLKAVPKSRATT